MVAKAIVKRIETYEESKIREILEENKDFILSGLKSGDRVLVKPNFISFNPPERAVTTHPVFIRAVVKFLLSNGFKVLVGDIPGRVIPTSKYPEISGLTGIKDENLEISELAVFGFNDVKRNFLKLDELHLPKVLWEVKKLFNLPKMKTHSLTFITGATKNLFGLTPRKDRLKIHRITSNVEFSKAVYDIAYSIPIPQIVIMDGIIGMEGDGPSYGTPVELDSVIITDDPLLADYAMTKIMGFREESIPLFKAVGIPKGEIIGLSSIPQKKCEPPKTFKASSVISTVAGVIFSTFINVVQTVPEVNKSMCIKCGVCAAKCPAKAITLSPYPVFDRDKCIMCYCCHELCPEGAIYLKKRIKIGG